MAQHWENSQYSCNKMANVSIIPFPHLMGYPVVWHLPAPQVALATLPSSHLGCSATMRPWRHWVRLVSVMALLAWLLVHVSAEQLLCSHHSTAEG